MLKLERRRLVATARATGWDLDRHVHRVYDTFRFKGGQPPGLVWRHDEERPAIQQSLMDWNADLGARDRMDWKGFLSSHRKLLRPLATLPRLGKLDPDGIGLLCQVVEKLENFKRTSGRKLVFGSKAAHFHFPGLVPVMSSEVQEALRTIESREPAAIAKLVHGEGKRFRFTSPETRRLAYKNYVSLGNALMAAIDTKTFLGAMSSARYDLHAKVFEWWVIDFRE